MLNILALLTVLVLSIFCYIPVHILSAFIAGSLYKAFIKMLSMLLHLVNKADTRILAFMRRLNLPFFRIILRHKYLLGHCLLSYCIIAMACSAISVYLPKSVKNSGEVFCPPQHYYRLKAEDAFPGHHIRCEDWDSYFAADTQMRWNAAKKLLVD